MGEPLRVLEALGREFDRLEAEPARRRRPGRALLVAIAVFLGAAGVAGATSYVLTGSPIPGAAEQDVPVDQRLEPGTARLAGAEAEDPGGGPKWDLRVSRSQTGELCTAVGQVHDGEFGLMGLDGRFRELPLQGVDACGSDPDARPAFIGAREFAADRPEDRRTVVNGVGGSALEDVRVEAAGREVDVARGSGGTFVAVLTGHLQQARPTVVLRFEDGTRREYRFGQTRYAEAPDPEGAQAWTVRADERPDGRTCAQARTAARLGLGGATPPACGDLARDHVFFDVRAFAAERDRGPYAWTFEPRTMVWGAADDTVERVEIVHRGERSTAVRTSADRGFVAALPGGTRPADVEVTVVFEDGRRVSDRGDHNLRDAEGERLERPLSEPRAPERDVSRQPRPMRPEPGSERIAEGRRLGELEVALRTFSTAGGRCGELGWVGPDGGFGVRRRDGTVEARPVGTLSGTCSFGGGGPNYVGAQLLDDGRAHDAHVVGSFVTGYAGRGAREVRIAGFGDDLVARPDRDGMFLAISKAREWPPGGIEVSIDGKSLRTPGFTPDPVVPGSIRVIARAPDPAGLQPYGILEWQQRPGDGRCTHDGQLVDGMAGSVNARGGVFFPFPLHEAGPCAEGGGGSEPGFPVAFGFSSMAGDEPPGERTPEQIARRTLSGRTIIRGRAEPSVRRVILQTPRDVRTFRPGAGGAFLVVYDGIFTTGMITVTAEYADGRTERTQMEVDR